VVMVMMMVVMLHLRLVGGRSGVVGECRDDHKS
jgi:hypothetical protein